MNILLTICARAGSKGVKNKNLKSLLGKPLIVHTIEQAKRWGRANDIIVSTDSQEIDSIAIEAGASVPFLRPLSLALDHSPKLPVIRHALFECEKKFEKTYEVIIDLDPTAPIRQEGDIANAFRLFIDKQYASLVSVVKAHKSPYFNMVEEDKFGNIQLCKIPTETIYRRQDAPNVYNLNASIYIYTRDFLVNEDNKTPLSTSNLGIYVMDELSAFDIDREIDFKFIEFLVHERMVSL